MMDPEAMVRVDVRNPCTWPTGWEVAPHDVPWVLGGRRVLRYFPAMQEWHASSQLDDGDYWLPMPPVPPDAQGSRTPRRDA